MACATLVFIGSRSLTALTRRERANGDQLVFAYSALTRAAKPFGALLAVAIGCRRRRVGRLLWLLRLLRLQLLLVAGHDHVDGADPHVEQARDLSLGIPGARQGQHGFLFRDALHCD